MNIYSITMRRLRQITENQKVKATVTCEAAKTLNNIKMIFNTKKCCKIVFLWILIGNTLMLRMIV